MSSRVMGDEQLLTAWAEYQRPLVRLASSILKDPNAAEDAVQEAFLRLAFQNQTTIDDVRGWLIVVVTRLCIDHLRSARHRREAPIGHEVPLEPAPSRSSGDEDPAEILVAVDDLRSAVATLLRRLTPAEQATFVLHDVFQMPFEQVADALQRSPEACRQLASRARRALDSGPRSSLTRPPSADVGAVTERFVAACHGASIQDLLEVLAPDVVGVADFRPLLPSRTLRGPRPVADRLHRLFGRKRFTLVATETDDGPAVLAIRRRTLRLVGVLYLTVERARVAHIEATNHLRLPLS